jgi:flagellar basal-body rod protein FlgB
VVKQAKGEPLMFERLELTAMSQAMMAHAGTRLAASARNIANADTPGYRAVAVRPFAQVWADGGGLRATRAGHLGVARDGLSAVRSGGTDPNGNGVSLEREMFAAAEARQQHEMALSIYRATADVLRASLGRR